jgi:cytochrome c oxidase assembly factor CtaG
MSFLGTYDRVLLWPLAVQDVLLLTVVPIGLTLGRPLALLKAVFPRNGRRSRLTQVLGFPLVGSVVAVTTLLLLYTTGWDAARLRSTALLELTRLLLVVVGCGFLWPLLGVDAGTGTTSYPLRAAIAFVDGLLDAIPGLAVLGSGHAIAGSYYLSVGRTYAQDQQIGGTAMVALSELVGVPALLVLLVQWMRSDARQAVVQDAELDARYEAGDVLLERPWWETDAGPLRQRFGQDTGEG